MNSFAFIFVCIQACLVQSALSQCTSRAAVADRSIVNGCGLGYGLAGAYDLDVPYGFAGYGDLAYPAAGWAGGLGYSIDAYGGKGEGNVAVAGELPVAGTTVVAGQVPIMGAVKFAGPVAAGGAVSIAGKCACGCGCGNDFPYLY